MLVDPVLGTSTKMHLCLCEITALPDCSVRIFECGSAGTRTRNQRLKRALLYRLSYRPVAETSLKYIAPDRNIVGQALRLPTMR
jgi:hypothetical protein